MALKGNLCWNGDLETGTTEEWSNKYWSYDNPPMMVMDGAGIDGGYALYIPIFTAGIHYGVCYDKVFPFEERELYFVEVYGKVVDATIKPVIQFLDGKKRPLGELMFGTIFWNDEWERMCALVARRFGASYFRVGFLLHTATQGEVYLDNLSVVGLTHSRDWVCGKYHRFSLSGEGYDDWYCNIAVFVRHCYSWLVHVRELSGSSPKVILRLRNIVSSTDRATDANVMGLKVTDEFTSSDIEHYSGSWLLYGYYTIRAETTGADTQAIVDTRLSLIPQV